MKRRASILLYTLIIGLLFSLSNSCQKDDPKFIAVLATINVSNITQSTATSGGNISNDGGALITARGVCWSKSGNPTINNNKTINAAGRGNFTSNITDLAPNTTYYVRAYATNSVGTSYGNTFSFKTLEELDSRTIVTTDVSEITQVSATSGGNITDIGGVPITARGVCWNTKESPTVEDKKTEDGEGTGSYSSNISNLLPNTTYFVRAYVITREGISYGNQITFSTNKKLESPSIVTAAATKITQTTAITGGDICNDISGPITARGVCWSKNENPTIDDNKTKDGEGSGIFTSNITKLEPNTTYYVRAYATNSVETNYGSGIKFTTKKDDAKVVDAAGNIYQIVTIGTQTWMAENLKTTKYKDGTAIPLVTENKSWSALFSSSYCWYDNCEITNKDTYGALYNWYTVNTGKLCPNGWHVPTDTEWTTLTTYLGGDLVAGGKLKETGSKHWSNPNKGATNETDFTALPAGLREIDGTFQNNKISSHWWSSTAFSNEMAWIRDIYYVEPYITRYASNKQLGLSVRCIRD